MRPIIDIINEALKLDLRTGETNSSPAREFMNDLHSQADENPFNARKRVIGQAQIEVYPSIDDKWSTIHISDVMSQTPGDGTKAMRLLCNLADQHGVTLELTAKGYDRTPTAALVKWYSGLGFENLGGDEHDGYDMERSPKKAIKLQGFPKRQH